MTQPRPKSNAQVRAIFGIAKERGLDNDALHDVVASVLSDGRRSTVDGREASIAKLSYAEAEKVIQRLKGQSFVPRRTLQWRRQKAGVKQLVTEAGLTKIAELASQRNWSTESLTKFCRRTIKRDRPATTKQANTIIEALKAMNERDDLWAA